MNTPKTLLATAALALVTSLPAVGQAPGTVLLAENFGDVMALSGWQLVNDSVPPGRSWFQGNAGVFSAHEGAPTSYIAANFLSADQGFGRIDNWLITPELSLNVPIALTFFTRGAAEPGFNDTLELRFSSGAGSAPSDFDTLLLTVGGTTTYPDFWQQYTALVPMDGSGRFAFHYTGDAEASNYIGIDTVSVVAVPEPSSCLMLGLGLGGLLLRRRTSSTA